jgi:transcriptional regulator with XRE-family HTH domain
MISPLLAIRQELGLSQDEFALLVAEWPPTISQIERGARKPTKRLLRTLAELGFDIANIQQEHTEFVKWKRERIFRELQTAS